MAGPDAGEEAENARGGRAGKQNGAKTLGNGGETRGLPGASVDGGRMIYTELNALTHR